jgi:hypothetical protein
MNNGNATAWFLLNIDANSKGAVVTAQTNLEQKFFPRRAEILEFDLVGAAQNLSNLGTSLGMDNIDHSTSQFELIPSSNIISKGDLIKIYLRDVFDELDALFENDATIWSLVLSWRNNTRNGLINADIPYSTSKVVENGQTHETIWRLFSIDSTISITTLFSLNMLIESRGEGMFYVSKSFSFEIVETDLIPQIENGLISVGEHAIIVFPHNPHVSHNIGLEFEPCIGFNVEAVDESLVNVSYAEYDELSCQYVITGCENLYGDCIIEVLPYNQTFIGAIIADIFVLSTDVNQVPLENHQSKTRVSLFWIARTTEKFVESTLVMKSGLYFLPLNIKPIKLAISEDLSSEHLHLESIQLSWDSDVLKSKVMFRERVEEADHHITNISTLSFPATTEDDIWIECNDNSILARVQAQCTFTHEFSKTTKFSRNLTYWISIRAYDNSGQWDVFNVEIDEIESMLSARRLEQRTNLVEHPLDNKFEELRALFGGEEPTLEVWALELYSIGDEPLELLYSNIFKNLTSLTSGLCWTHIMVFEGKTAIKSIFSPSNMSYITGSNGLWKVRHNCTDPIYIKKYGSMLSTNVVLLAHAHASNSLETGTISIPVIWKSFVISRMPQISLQSVGPQMLPQTSVAKFLISVSHVNPSDDLIIVLSHCDGIEIKLLNSTVAQLNTESPGACKFDIIEHARALGFYDEQLQWAIEIEALNTTYVNESKSIGLELQFYTSNDSVGEFGSWSSGSFMSETTQLQYCELCNGGLDVFFANEGEHLVLDIHEIILNIFPSAEKAICIGVMVIASQDTLNSFYVDEKPITPAVYNDTAWYVMVHLDRDVSPAWISYLNPDEGSAIFDVMLLWRDLNSVYSWHDNGSTSCSFRQNVVIYHLFKSHPPILKSPHTYNRKTLQAEIVDVEIPMIAIGLSTYNTGSENGAYLELILRMNVSITNFQSIEYHDNPLQVPLSDDPFVDITIVNQSEHLSYLDDISLRLIPNDTFTGTVKLELEVIIYDESLHVVNGLEEYSSTTSTIEELYLEWIPRQVSNFRPTTESVSIYRSTAVELMYQTSLEFSYKIDSREYCAHLY